MKRLGFILLLVSFLLISGCQMNNANEDLVKVQEKIDHANLAFKIPKLEGYEVNYVHQTFQPKDEQGNIFGSKQEILITYTKNKGKLMKLTKDRKKNDEREILYGPYEGESLIEITYNNIQSDLDNSDRVEMNGEQVQRAKIGEHTFLLFNDEKGSITMNYENLDEASISSITQQVIKENK